MKELAITFLEQRCGARHSDALFCQAYSTRDNASEPGRAHSVMSNAVAGMFDALVTLGEVGLAAMIVLFSLRRRASAKVALLAQR
jgi:hypothetical protein